MELTPTFEFPYPDLDNGEAPAGPEQMKAIVQAVEDRLAVLEQLLGTPSNPPTPTPGELVIVDGTSDPVYKAVTGDIAFNSGGVSQIGAGKVVAGNVGVGAITLEKLAAAVQAALIPAGSIFSYGGAEAPTGFLLLEGQVVSRATYAAIFAAYGTKWGAGNGTTTFGLPDGRGSVLVGADGGAGRVSANNALGNRGGEEKHTMTEAEMPSHTHGVTDPGHVHAVDVQNFEHWSANGPQETTVHVGSGLATHPAATGISIQAKGGGGAHNNLQPYLVVNHIVKT